VKIFVAYYVRTGYYKTDCNRGRAIRLQ